MRHAVVRRRLRPLAVFAALLAASFAGAQKPANDFRLADDHAGPIRATTTFADLKRIFDASQVTDRMLYGAEGDSVMGCTVLPNSPDRFDVVWANVRRARIASLRFGKPGAHWRTALGGVSVGMPLTELVKRNGGKPLQISGFDWDYGGYISDWGGGPLGKVFGGKNHITVRLGYDHNRTAHLSQSTLSAVSGEKPLSSSDAAVQAIQPRVEIITVDF